MNVLIGSHYFLPHRGGIESVVESHAKRLTERGHNVLVVTSDVGGDSRHVSRDGYEVFRYKAWNPIERFGAPYPLPNYSDVRRIIAAILTETEIDVVHVHGLNYLTTTAVLHTVPSEVPTVLHQHTPFVHYPLPFELAEHVNDRTIGYWNLSQADLVYCVSRPIEQYVNSIRSGTRTRVLTNGVDTDRFTPDRALESTELPNSGDGPTFFTLTRLTQKKGIDLLMEAIRKTSNTRSDANFVIAGKGPLEAEVESFAADFEDVEFVGTVDEERLPGYYAAADGFLFTSKSGDAFPTLTMMESLASGTPVIAAELSDHHPGIVDGGNSVLIEPDDGDELATVLTRLSADESRLAEMAQPARESAQQHFSVESRIDEIESAYRALVSSAN